MAGTDLHASISPGMAGITASNPEANARRQLEAQNLKDRLQIAWIGGA